MSAHGLTLDAMARVLEDLEARKAGRPSVNVISRAGHAAIQAPPPITQNVAPIRSVLYVNGHGGTYTVVLYGEGDHIRDATCSCPAAQAQRMCWHLLTILTREYRETGARLET